MADFILIPVAMVSYLCAIMAVTLSLKAPQARWQWLATGLSITALSLHATLLHQKIDIGIGQNLAALNLISLTFWFTGLVAVLVGLTQQMNHLKIILFSLSLLSIALMAIFPGCQIIQMANNPKQLMHVLLSTAAFGVFYLAGFQAVLLAIQEYQLHHRKLNTLLRALPSLQTMEVLLFQLLVMGFILFTGVVITSIWFFYAVLTPQLIQKMAISLLVWSTFATLLVGRVWYGWRGQLAVRWTISGVILVTVVYFSSKLFVY